MFSGIGSMTPRECQYDRKNNIFKLSMHEGYEEYYYQSVLRCVEADHRDYELYILCNERDDTSENSIYQVNDKSLKKRIGWLFPVQALFSTDHDYAENKHFLIYAYVGLYMLLMEHLDDWRFGSEEGNELSIKEELLNKHVLIICKSNMEHSFKLKEYKFDLFAHGYSEKGKGNLLSKNTLGGIDETGNSKMKIRRVDNIGAINSYIMDIFGGDFLERFDELATFHILYQVVEILIEQVLKDEIDNIIVKLKKETRDYHKVKNDLTDIMKESTRVNKLFEEYTVVRNDLKKELQSECQSVLPKEDIKNMADAIYSVRNMIVHRYHEIHGKRDQDIQRINAAFLDVILEALINFKEFKEK